MEKFKIPDYFDKLQAEIVKLKDIEILSYAESLEISFNCPKSVLKEIAEEMNQRALGQPGTKFSPEEYIRKVYDGVLIFPIKNDEPVIVFKKFGYGLSQLRVYIDVPSFEESIPISATYMIYWKGKFHKVFPPTCERQYFRNFAFHLMHGASLGSYGGIELPLKLIFDEERRKIFDPHFIKPIKKALRELKVLVEKRGKHKNKGSEIKKYRDKILISSFKKLGSPDRLPIKKLQKLYKDELDRKNEIDKIGKIDDLDGNTDEKEYDCSDMTIRRVLQKYKAEKKALKEIKEWQMRAPDFKKIHKEHWREIKKDPRFTHIKNVKQIMYH